MTNRAKHFTQTWEDPEVDVQKLGINADDNILAITSAGDNVLHYAIASNVHTIHAVDMNPCQVSRVSRLLPYSTLRAIFSSSSLPRLNPLHMKTSG